MRAVNTPGRQVIHIWIELLQTDVLFINVEYRPKRGSTKRSKNQTEIKKKKKNKLTIPHEIENTYFESQLKIK